MNSSQLSSLVELPLLVAMANQTAEALIVLDKKFQILLFNYSAEKLFGLPSEKIIGLSLVDACRLSNIEPFINNRKILHKTGSIKIPSVIHNKNIYWQVERVKIRDLYFYLLKTMDLVERENLNEIYKFETLIENMPCNVYWVDKDCKMIGCNQNVLDMLNMTQEQFRGKSYEELSELCNWPIGLAAKLKADDQSVMNTGCSVIAKEDPPIPHADGSFSNFLTSRVPIRNNDGEIVGIAGISADVTPLKEARKKAEIASNAKTEFIANMSHDIRTPLSGVVGMSQLLEESLVTPEQKQYARWIYESGEQLLTMLNGILDVVSADNVNENDIHLESFDLRQCIQEIVQLERPTTTLKNLALNVKIDSNVPRYIISDHTKIHRILLNLLGNAIKFTEEGGITIEILLLAQNKKNVKLRFSVIDTGIGIPTNHQDKVFDRFFRISPSSKGIYAGHGVGLHIAKSYVGLLGGEIKLISKENVGTTFYFDLTLDVGKDGVSQPATKAIKYSKTQIINRENSPHLLLVEDNVVALHMIEAMATKAGCTYLSAVNGEEALALAKKEKFDIIISDVGLPGISGHELARRIREDESYYNKTPAPIIGLSAHAREQALDDCLKAGMDDVFTKPVNLDMMEEILKKFASAKSSLKHNRAKMTITTTKPGKLGLDLPDTEAQLFELEIFPLLDVKNASESMGGEGMLPEILQLMINQEIPRDINAIKNAYADKNLNEIERIAHKMKGGTVYCGTVRMKYACQYLERYLKAGYNAMLDKLYQQLIDITEKTKIAVEEWLRQR